MTNTIQDTCCNKPDIFVLKMFRKQLKTTNRLLLDHQLFWILFQITFLTNHNNNDPLTSFPLNEENVPETRKPLRKIDLDQDAIGNKERPRNERNDLQSLNTIMSR